MLVKGDSIAEGSTSLRYRGIRDDIFYKVFRYKYEEEIENLPLDDALAKERKKQKKEIEKRS